MGTGDEWRGAASRGGKGVRRSGVSRKDGRAGGGSGPVGTGRAVGLIGGSRVASAFSAVEIVVPFIAALAEGGVERNANEAGGSRIPAGAATRIFTRGSCVPIIARTSLGASVAVFLGEVGNRRAGLITRPGGGVAGMRALSLTSNVAALKVELADDIRGV